MSEKKIPDPTKSTAPQSDRIVDPKKSPAGDTHDAKTKKQQRENRLGDALRANLRRRKNS